MNIKFSYRQSLEFSENEQDFLLRTSRKFGTVETKTYSSRSGALDLVSIIETTLTFVVLTNFQAYSKGLIGEDWFKKLGIKTRQEIEAEIIQAKAFVEAYFEVFVKDKENRQEAFVITENIGEVTLFVVINHYNMNNELLEKLPKALVDTYGRISLGYIKIESNTCQLFPDFENNEWRYLFTPTLQGFGNFVDQYFDLKTNRLIKINSKLDFANRFNLNEEDKYKIIINSLIER
jgi:hypothetical protein